MIDRTAYHIFHHVILCYIDNRAKCEKDKKTSFSISNLTQIWACGILPAGKVDYDIS